MDFMLICIIVSLSYNFLIGDGSFSEKEPSPIKNVEFCDEKLDQFRRKLLPNKEKCVNIKNEN